MYFINIKYDIPIYDDVSTFEFSIHKLIIMIDMHLSCAYLIYIINYIFKDLRLMCLYSLHSVFLTFFV